MKISIKHPEPPKDFCTIVLTEHETKMLLAIMGSTVSNRTPIGKFSYKFYKDVLDTAFNGDIKHIIKESLKIANCMIFKE